MKNRFQPWPPANLGRTFVTLVTLAGLVGAAGCGPGGEPAPEPRTTHDLLAELVTAEPVGEVAEIDFGTTEARRFLGRGWSADEVDPSGRSFVWGMGGRSHLELPIFRRRDMALRIVCHPFPLPGGLEQRMTIEVAGSEVAEVALPRGRRTVRVVLPAEKLEVGRNRLTFRYAHTREPRGSSDGRLLAVAFHRLTVEGVEPPPPAPRVDPEGRRLFLPRGLELHFHLRLEPGSALVADGWSFRGDARLEVEVEVDGDEVWRTAVDRSEPPSPGVALPGEGVARLTLRSLATPDDGANPGVTLDAPRVTASASAEEPPAGTAAAPTSGAPEPEVRNVVMYLVDTLRADHLGCYGYPREVSPAIDAFARDAVLFERSIAQSSWTRAAVASILTGLGPVDHGTNRRNHPLAAAAVTLQELLAERGYATAAFISNPNLAAEVGFDQGFDHFVDLGGTEVDGTTVVRRAVEWLDQRDDERPFFALVHTIDPHSPYDPPPEHRRRLAPGVPPSVVFEPATHARALQRGKEGRPGQPTLEQIRRLYDAEIAANDQAFGELVAALRARDLYDDAAILVLSDHGEEFLEHGALEHGKQLYGESVRVPLIVRLGEATRPGRVGTVVQHLDVLPTVLDAVGAPVPEGLEGSSLRRWIVGPEDGGPAPAQSPEEEADRPIVTYLHLDGRPRIAVRQGGWKLIYLLRGERWQRPRLFHLPSDPGELQNLAAERPVRVGYLRTLLRRHLLDPPEGRLESESVELDDALRERLEALGYMG